ncbi:MAG: hypothetical protein J6A88_03585 [Oscillospiraceae bacterium]|nr:hypothetical protein [Oscillospiraceae bacterium]
MDKKVWIILSAVLLVIIVIVVIAASNQYYVIAKQCEEAVFGHTYGHFSTIHKAMDTGHPNPKIPAYEITKDGTIIDHRGSREVVIGSLLPIEITEDNFDNYFDREWDMPSGDYRAVFREQIKAAWSYSGDNYMCYWILDNDGDIYICHLSRITDASGSARWSMGEIHSLRLIH